MNRPIEQCHNEIREILKARHVFGNDESAQTFSELLRINHNFVKIYHGLDCNIPVYTSNIDLNLEENKYLT